MCSVQCVCVCVCVRVCVYVCARVCVCVCVCVCVYILHVVVVAIFNVNWFFVYIHTGTALNIYFLIQSDFLMIWSDLRLTASNNSYM